jgi:type II secretory pathway component PulF
MAMDFNQRFVRMQFSGKTRLRTYRKISRLLKNSVPLSRALETMYAHASLDGRKPKNVEAIVLDAWLRQIKNGKPLGVAIQGWVPEMDRLVIEAGEPSGDLPGAIENACFLYEGQKQIKVALYSSLAYPCVLFAMVIGFLFLFGLNVIPKFETVLPRDKWEGVGAQMASMSDFVSTGFLPLLVALGGLGVLVGWSLPRWTGPLRVKFDKYPPYGIYKVMAGSGFLLGLAALTKAGVKTTVALRALMRDSKPWYHERISKTLGHVNNGLNIGEALFKTNLGFPDAETVNDLRTYATLDKFDEMLMRLGRENMDESVNRIKQQGQMLKNAGIILVGATLAWLFMGIFSIQQQISASL